MRTLEAIAAIFVLVFTVQNTIASSGHQLFPTFSSNCGYRDRDFILITRALSNGLNFFTENINTLVQDAGVGTTIMERQIELVLDSNQNLPKKVSNILKKLLYTAKSISRGIVERIRKEGTDEHSKNITLPWITSELLWNTPKIGYWKRFGSTVEPSPIRFKSITNFTEVLNEYVSDACIGELFEGCRISESCGDFFLGKPDSKYSLTHQVIFHHIADQVCMGKPAFTPTKSPEAWRKRLWTMCADVYSEAIELEREDFPPRFQDLFAEQIVVCGVAGIQDFLRPSWMYKLLFWQQELNDNMACFWEHDEDPGTKNEDLRRQKRSDISIDYDSVKCSVHYSTVALAALSLHLRHLLETCT